MAGAGVGRAGTQGRLRLPETLLGLLARAPGRTAWGLLAGYAAAYLATAALTGNLGALVDADHVFHLHPLTRANGVLASVAAFSLWALLSMPGRGLKDLAGLRPILELGDGRYDEWQRRLLAGFRPRWTGAVGGVALAVFITIYSNYRLYSGWGWNFRFHDWWTLSLMLVLFALMGELCRRSVSLSLLLSRLGRDHTRVRLLERDELRPFVRCGVRLGRNWFIGSSIAMLLLLDFRLTGVVLGVLVATFGLGITGLLLPSVGVHQRLRNAKLGELASLRAAIEAGGTALASRQAPGPEDDARLSALIAYEARIERAGEWPFDTPTLLRFALLVLLPIGSWVAGALVEHLVDAVLG